MKQTFTILLATAILNAFGQEKDPIISQLDESIGIFAVEHYTEVHDTTSYLETYGFERDSIPKYLDSVIEDRFKEIQEECIIPISNNIYVQNYINVYTAKKREQVGRMLGLSDFYYPIFEEALDKAGLPMELKNLPVIESALNPLATSRAGASGLWQFMYGTGKIYDLKVTSYLDERRDIYKSTEAATLFLKDLYKTYKDWLLVIAAYNCGPGRVNRAIHQSGGARNFWEIRRYLPRETRGYVPAFIAANYVMRYYEQHNIYKVPCPHKLHMIDTVMVRKRASFDEIENQIGISKQELAFLNPAVRRNIIPELRNGYVLRLPQKYIHQFYQQEDTIYAHTPAVDEGTEFVKTNYTTSSSSGGVSAIKGMTRLTYAVKEGDNLGFIAERYHCKAQDIRNWNGIYGSRIRIGQRLNIFVPNSEASKFTKNSSASEANYTVGSSNGNYVVRYGDTLWDISRKFPCITMEELKKINHISGSNITPGMILKIKKC